MGLISAIWECDTCHRRFESKGVLAWDDWQREHAWGLDPPLNTCNVSSLPDLGNETLCAACWHAQKYRRQHEMIDSGEWEAQPDGSYSKTDEAGLYRTTWYPDRCDLVHS